MGTTAIAPLERAECLRLLASEEVGRLAVIASGDPMIFPVNYVLDAESVVFRTAPGSKLDDGPRARACFEIDCFDRSSHRGWSVVAVGRLEEVTSYDPPTFARVQKLGVDPWAGGDRSHWMRLVPDSITGRSVGSHVS